MFRGRTHVNGKKLFDHQIKGVEFMINRAIGCMNTSEMGTGKTAMAIVASDDIAPAKILVICPNILRHNWEKEFESWCEIDRKIHVVEKGTKQSKEKKLQGFISSFAAFKAVIINYDAVASMFDLLTAYKADMIIIDESHLVKNHKAKRTKLVTKLASLATYKFVMTGTPSPNNPLDIWSQMNIIRPGHLSNNYYVFRSRYADVYTGGGFPMIKSFRRLDELNKLVSQYTYRVTKEECLDLPDKTFVTIEIEMGAKTKKIYEDMASEMVAEIEPEIEVSAEYMLTKMIKLQQITSGFIKVEDKTTVFGDDKIVAFKELMETFEGEHVVVWAKFKAEIDMIKAALDEMKIDCRVLTGDVKEEDRIAGIKHFNESEKQVVLVANTAIGGAGLTLTRAKYSVYYSRNFSLGDARQSEDRIHRIGQTRNVTYYDLVCKGTIDSYICKSLAKKQTLADKLTGDDVKKMLRGDV